VVVICGDVLCGLFPPAAGVSLVGGWFGWSVGGSSVVGGGGDGSVVWRGRCVVPISVICLKNMNSTYAIT